MKTTGVKDVPKKILLFFLGHPTVDAKVSLNLVEKGETGLSELRESLFARRVGRAAKFWRQFEHL